MAKSNRHITRSVSSSIDIRGRSDIIWDQVTNVNIEDFSDPVIFRLLGIPRPLKADMMQEGEGGQRIAYFESGKRFVQEITSWNPCEAYSFNFNPDKGFKVAYFFDISDGVFRILRGSYLLTEKGKFTQLHLTTTYSLDRRIYFLFQIPVWLTLMAFQKYLLRSIKKNSE